MGEEIQVELRTVCGCTSKVKMPVGVYRFRRPYNVPIRAVSVDEGTKTALDHETGLAKKPNTLRYREFQFDWTMNEQGEPIFWEVLDEHSLPSVEVIEVGE